MSDVESNIPIHPRQESPRLATGGDAPRGPLRPPLRSPHAPAPADHQRPTTEHRRLEGRKQRRPTPTDPGLLAAIRAAAAHKRGHRPDRESAEKMARAYRAVLIPREKSGSKPQPETVQAAKLYRARIAEAGAGNQPVTHQSLCKLWEGIKREVIPGFDALDKYERKCRGDELRRNTKGVLKRQGVKLLVLIRARRKRQAAIN